MSTTTLTPYTFIFRFINKCPLVRSSRLDQTLKAIISIYSKENNSEVITYLNKLRIIYYLRRLGYLNPLKAKVYKGIPNSYSI